MHTLVLMSRICSYVIATCLKSHSHLRKKHYITPSKLKIDDEVISFTVDSVCAIIKSFRLMLIIIQIKKLTFNTNYFNVKTIKYIIIKNSCFNIKIIF